MLGLEVKCYESENENKTNLKWCLWLVPGCLVFSAGAKKSRLSSQMALLYNGINELVTVHNDTMARQGRTKQNNGFGV